MTLTPPSQQPYQWSDLPSEGTPLDTQHLQAAENQLIAYVQEIAQLLGIGPTDVQSVDYAAQAGDFVPVDATASSLAVTLPTAPADNTRVGVKMIATASGHTVTINTGGSDVFNKTGGPTSITLTQAGDTSLLQYQASRSVWHEVAHTSTASGNYASLTSSSQQAFTGEVQAPDFKATGLTGATSASRYVGATATSAPASGTFQTGDWVITQNGHLKVCTSGGTPGTWGDVGASAGVSSFNSRVGAVSLTKADVTGTGLAAADVSALTSFNTRTGPAITSGNADYLAVSTGGLTGATAATRFVGGTTSGAPVSGTFAIGDFVVDRTGKLWVCTTAGTPGTWTNPAAASASAGGTPTAADTGGAGNTSVSCLGGSKDQAGIVQFTTSVTPGAGNQIAVSFSGALAATPVIAVSAYNANAATASGGTAAQCWYVAATSTTGFTLAAGITPSVAAANQVGWVARLKQ